MYALIGKGVVRLVFFYMRQRFRSQIRIGAGIVALAVGVAAYYASRNVPEG